MASAYSWPIRQQTFSGAAEAFWEIVDHLVDDLGFTLDESSPNPWRANYTLLANLDYVVLGSPGSAATPWQVKLTYRTNVYGGNPGFTSSISPKVAAGAFGTNPVTTPSVSSLRLGLAGTVRVTLLGTSDNFMIVSEWAGGNVDLGYFGRYEPFEDETNDPYPVTVSCEDMTDWYSVFASIEDPTGTPAEVNDGFIWIPTRAGVDSSISPLKAANVQNTKSLNYKQSACVLELSDGAVRRLAGRLPGIYMLHYPPSSTNWGVVWGTPGAYVAYLGVLVPWPDSTPGLAFLS